jgi:DNA-binding response OmpR family regulator
MDTDRPKILLVIDDELLSDVTEFRLSLLGYDVETEREGNAAIQRVEVSPPDLIIVSGDIHDMDCIDFVNVIRTRAQVNEVPVIVFSVESGLDAVRRAFAAGTSAYVITPYDPAILETKIESLLSHQPRTRRALV